MFSQKQRFAISDQVWNFLDLSDQERAVSNPSFGAADWRAAPCLQIAALLQSLDRVTQHAVTKMALANA
jgi:hypothetical protein